MQLDPKEQSLWPGLICFALIVVLLIVGIWLMDGDLMDIP